MTAPAPGEGGAPVSDPPRPTARAVFLRFAAVVTLLVGDLASKAAVFAWLGPRPAGVTYDAHGHPRWTLLGDWLAFMLSWNPGMAWGIDAIPAPALVGGRALAVLFLAWLVARTARGRALFTSSIVLILSGALGNLYDNLFLAPRRAGARFGEVRDFIDVYFPIWDWHFPTFNVADSCITVGAVLLLLSSLLPQPGRGEGAP